jgi:hypothetical protein
LLTLMHVDDPWFQAPHLKGSCATKIADRKNAKHVTVQSQRGRSVISMWPISTRGNKPENDDPAILEPV